jgi:hypothetical protein
VRGDAAWAAVATILWICAVIDIHAVLAEGTAPTDITISSTGDGGSNSSEANSIEGVSPLSNLRHPHNATHAPEISVRHASISRTPPKGLRAYTEDEIQDLIRVYAGAFGIDAEIPLAIARCESQFHWDAVNRSSSARGVFQYVAGTWAATPEGRHGTSVFDAEANIRMALTHMMTIGTSPWNASRACWDA